MNRKTLVFGVTLIAAAGVGVGVWIFMKQAAPPRDTKTMMSSEPTKTELRTLPKSSPPVGATRPNDATTRTAAARGERPARVHPFKLYSDNIAQANAGVARSQYRIAQAMQMCRMAPTSEESIDEQQRAGLISDELRDISVQLYRDCKDLLAVAPKPGEEFVRWLRKAAEGGDPLAKSWDALWSYPSFDESELRTLVLEAVKTGAPEARKYVVMYYANVPQVAADAGARYQAWVTLDCEITLGCDLAETRKRQKQDHKAIEYMQIVAAEAQIRKALQERRWDDLGLSPP